MNRFGMLSQEEKMGLLELSVAEVFNRGYEYCGMDNESGSFTVIEEKEEKSNNQQRKELIQEAKDKFKNKILFDGYVDVDDYTYLLSFQVNSEAGVVVALVKDFNGKVIRKGIARCMSSDVFNEDIGKYIATSRALKDGIEDRFLDPVQPDEVVVGTVVKWKYGGDTFKVEYMGELGNNSVKHTFYCLDDKKTYSKSYKESILNYSNIVDDTDSKY